MAHRRKLSPICHSCRSHGGTYPFNSVCKRIASSWRIVEEDEPLPQDSARNALPHKLVHNWRSQ